jgi:dihydroorotate dehydrogenase electron transfer subunit
MQIPLQSRLPKTHPIAQVKQETPMVRTLTFDVSFGAKPGQFVMLWLPGVDEIPMSVALDDGKNLQVTFFAVGDTTKKLAECNKGDLVGLRGPFGTHYEWKPKQHLALVPGGYGAAPMFFVAKEAAKDGCTLDVFIGARSREHLLYVSAFRKLPKTKVHIATDDGSEGFKGFNVTLLQQVIAEGSSKPFHQVFACGPERMLVAISELSFRRKIPSQLSLERYMKCGYGLCGNCTVDSLGIRLCTDGPVVHNDLCRKIAEFGKYHRDALGKKQIV